jgi:ribosomal protein S27E
MKLVCPECKNDVDLTSYPDVKPDHVVECDKCGITLMVTAVNGSALETEIVDEGK